MEIINDCEEGEEFCLVTISLPASEADRELTEANTSFMCPPGTQLISLEGSAEYYIASDNTTEYKDYESTNEIRNTEQEDGGNASLQCIYAVTVSQDSVNVVPDIQQVLQSEGSLVTPRNKYNVEFHSLDTECIEENNGLLYEEHSEQLEVENIHECHTESDTILYSNGNVYVLREQSELELEHQYSHCNNVLREYGYVFVNEESTNENAECEEEDEEEKVDVETLGEVVSAFKCVSCDFTTLDKSALVHHHSQVHCCGAEPESELEKVEKQDVVYVCGQCSIELPSVEVCRQHMILEHNILVGTNSQTASQQEESENSALCLQMEEKLRKYWLHNGTCKNIKARLCSDRKIRCTVRKCVYRFSTYDKMEKHKICHTTSSRGEPQSTYMCNHCNDGAFAKWSQCSLHLHKYHNVSLDIINCPLCRDHSTYSVRLMATHLQKHAEKEGVNDEQNARWYSRKTCQICKKTYVNSKILSKHMKSVHYKLKPFKCTVCGHSSSLKNMLQLHMRQHTGEKPYQCEFCPYQTGDHNTLLRHRRTHTKKHPYSCKLCPYSCIQKGALNAHMKSKHPELNAAPKGNKPQEEPIQIAASELITANSLLRNI